MGRRAWATADEWKWLTGHLPSFYKAQAEDQAATRVAAIQQEYFTRFWRDDTVPAGPGVPVTLKDFVVHEDGRKITKAQRMKVSDTSLRNLSTSLPVL